MLSLNKRKSLHKQVEKVKNILGASAKYTEFESLSGLHPTNQTSVGVGNLPVSLDLNPTLSGFLFNREERQLVDIYKDIYYYDVVGGTAVDLLSTLPFSDISLRGVDSKMERPFFESLERLNINSLLPEVSVDYLVFGNFIASLVFNQERKIFIDVIPHDFKNCTIKDFPFYGVDPIINVMMPKDLTNILKDDNDRVNQIKSNYGEALFSKLCEGQIELEPLSTLYIPRRTMTCAEGTSYFRRILPIYFMEKNLYRGSLAESIKRLRSILHITLGDIDWEPSPEDMQFISELFINADNDPIGAIVATRNGVETNEIRCISGETIINTNNGEMKIKDFVPHNPETLKEGTSFITDLKVFSVDGLQSVDYWWYQGYKETFKVVTESGDEIVGTQNHKIITIEDGLHVQKTIADIFPGKTFAIMSSASDKAIRGVPKEIFYEFFDSRYLGISSNPDYYEYKNDDGEVVLVKTSTMQMFKNCLEEKGYLSYRGFELAVGYELSLIGSISKTFLHTIKLLVCRRCYFSKIISVTSQGKEHVYDLTMNCMTAPVYYANKFLVKNSGGDFWKIEDMWNTTIPIKLKALNLSESFISGESSVQTLEGSMSGFVENLRTYRNMLTRKIFYEKIFPLISLTNEFYINDEARVEAQKLRNKRNSDLGTLLYQMRDTSSLVIPQVLWEKNLKPEGDNNYMDILKTMTEAGIPVPIRTLAAAGGIKLERILKEQEEDLETRKKVKEYNEKIASLTPKQDSEDDMYASALASAFDNLPTEHKVEFFKALPKRESLMKLSKPNLLQRFKGKEEEVFTTSATGKKKHVINQTKANNEINNRISKAASLLQKKGKLL